MQSYIITGGTQKEKEKKIEEQIKTWNIHPVDCVTIESDDEHIGIDAVRQFKKRLQLAPFQSPHTLGLIRNSQRLTAEAQNALLKLLEEPPARAYLIIETDSVDQLLPTVISRCEIRTAGAKTTNEQNPILLQTIQSLIQTSAGNKLAIIDTIATDRITAKIWVKDAIEVLRYELLHTSSYHYTVLLRLLLSAQKQLDVNVNWRLVLDNTFLF
jgi:DNA polymerase III delta prime subunit